MPGTLKSALDWSVRSLEFPGKPAAALMAKGRATHARALDALRSAILSPAV